MGSVSADRLFRVRETQPYTTDSKPFLQTKFSFQLWRSEIFTSRNKMTVAI